MHPVFIQAIAYSVLLVLCLALVGAFQRGFFWKYCKVRTSFGKYILVKVRSPLRDYFAVGWVDEGSLVYKHRKSEKRLAIDSSNMHIYRSVAVNWIDVDEEKDAISKTDYSAVTGYDAQKQSDLLTRCLMRPSISSNKEKLVIVLLIIIGVGVLLSAYFSYSNIEGVQALKEAIPGMLSNIRTTVTGSVTNI